jgi:hypothetical protein
VADDLAKLLDDLNLDLDAVDDPKMRGCLAALLNIVQQLNAENTKLREENQRLKDEITRLKGEQGRPNIKPNAKGGRSNVSSQKGRKQKKPRVPRQKMVEVDRTEPCPVDRETLPEDAVYKGTETKVIQDIVFRRDNVAFKREKYWSPSLNKVFYGPLPKGYGDYSFGPAVRALVVTLYYATGAREPKILELLASRGVKMSSGELSNLLVHDREVFHEECPEVHQAGLDSGPWQQIDDTSTRVNGGELRPPDHCWRPCLGHHAIPWS